MDRLNSEYEQTPPQNMEKLTDLVADLHENPSAPSVPTPVDLSPVPSVTSETVTETPIQPLLLAKCTIARLAPTKAKPRPPTAAAKCPRAEYSGQQKKKELKQRIPKKSKSLISLQEIRKYQTESKPLLPFLPFVRVVCEALYNQGPYKITHGALHALRIIVEDHLIHVFEGSNLTCMHRDRCTLAPWDIHLYCHLCGDKDMLGIEPHSQEAKECDWEKFREGRLTVSEAMVLDTERRRKLWAQMRKKRRQALVRAGHS